jgi:Rieske Fe-S protein
MVRDVAEMAEKRASRVTRRQVLCATGAGLAAVTLPACAVPEFPYVPMYGGEGGSPSPTGEDAGPGSPDTSTQAQPDSSTMADSSPPTDGGAPTDSATSDSGSSVVDSGSVPPADTAPPPPTCMQNSNTLVVPISQYPALGSTGGSVALTDSRYTDPVCQQDAFYVVTTGPGQYAAFSSSCTHECCTIEISGSTATCPCHGAEFDVATGAVTQGPARKNLPALPGVCTDGTNIYLQLA